MTWRKSSFSNATNCVEAAADWRTSSYTSSINCVECGSWAKSSYSFANGNCIEWRKSTHSESGNCLEVRGGVQVRDSKDKDGPVLAFPAAAWEQFTTSLRP